MIANQPIINNYRDSFPKNLNKNNDIYIKKLPIKGSNTLGCIIVT